MHLGVHFVRCIDIHLCLKPLMVHTLPDSGRTHPGIWRSGMKQRERSVWDLVESVSILFMRGYLAARARVRHLSLALSSVQLRNVLRMNG